MIAMLYDRMAPTYGHRPAASGDLVGLLPVPFGISDFSSCDHYWGSACGDDSAGATISFEGAIGEEEENSNRSETARSA